VTSAPAPTLILTVDLEDWQQLVARRIGLADSDRPGPGLARQCAALLGTLDRMSASATFFVLGLSARRHPQLVRELAARGHEIASHGYAHRPVRSQSPRELANDLAASIELLGELTGKRPLGYRAPAFSISRDAAWAFELIAEQGFRYDSSLHDSPRIRDRITPAAQAPYRLELRSGATLWELPIAVARLRGRVIPLGGGAYWRLLPKWLVRNGLALAARSGPQAIYAHPYECDPQPLRVQLPPTASPRTRLHARLRECQRNPRRTRALELLAELGHTYELITCEQAVERNEQHNRRAGPGALQRTRA
jgi:polysaccharide deacetylase family protein (PEP-CTERM system associated)